MRGEERRDGREAGRTAYGIRSRGTGAGCRTDGRRREGSRAAAIPPAGPPGRSRGPGGSCARRLSPAAGLYRPGSDDYRLLALPDNLRYADVLPAGIVACATERDVQVAVQWAARARRPPRATLRRPQLRRVLHHPRPPHQPPAYERRGCSRHPARARRRHHQLGRLRGQSSQPLFPRRPLPGRGRAGLTLGGGLGFNDRKWGLTCDRLVETRVILAGRLTGARGRRREPWDLFWACRGGAGGNFGINTAFVFDTTRRSADLLATVFDLTFDLTSAVPLVAAVQEILAADDAGDFDVRIGFKTPRRWPGGAVALLGQRLGDEAALRGFLAPVLELRTYEESSSSSGTSGPPRTTSMEQPGAGVGATASKSLVPDRWLNPGTVESVAEWVRGWRPGVWVGNSGYVTLFAMGGRSGAVEPGETAYPHRDATLRHRRRHALEPHHPTGDRATTC